MSEVEVLPSPYSVTRIEELRYMSADVRAKFEAIYGWRVRQLQAEFDRLHPAAPPAAQPPDQKSGKR